MLDTCIVDESVDDGAGDVDDAGLRACVNALPASAPFPAPRGGPIDVTFPFAFAPTD